MSSEQSYGPQRFRKKPVEIDAWPLPRWGQPNHPGSGRPSEDEPVFSAVRYVDECIAVAEWCGGISHMMVNADEMAFDGASVPGPHMTIPTLEGEMIASPGDFIIRGVNGEFYPCKPDIFAKTYEQVSA